MKKLRGLLFGVIATCVIAPFSLAGCSETTHVEEKVNVGDNTVPAPAKDVKVNVQVEGNTPQQPVVIEKKETVNKTTNITNVQPAPEKKIEVHNHITNINPPAETVQKDVSVNTDTSGTVVGTTTQTTETKDSY